MSGPVLSSLRVRLLALVLVAAVPIVAIVVVSAREHREVLASRASEGATALAQLVAERHQRSVDAARGLLLALSRMPSILGLDGMACSRGLAPLLERAPIFVNMGAVHPDGRMFCSAAPHPGPIDLSDRTFYRDALRTGGLGVGEYVVSRVRGLRALGFGYPVHDGEERLVAVAYASLAVARLQEDLDELELPDGSEVAVLDRRGITISARPEGEEWAGKAFERRIVEALGVANGPVALTGTDGTNRLFDLREVTAPDGTVAMLVVAGIPTGALLDPVNAVSNRALLGSLLASALALAAAGLMAEFMLVRRLRRLAVTSRLIAAGDWSARTELTPGRDEMGDLVRSFDEMARSLEQLERQKRAREEELRQAQKMEAVGRLAGGVAHDFNNLLTVILSAANGLREQLPADHPGQEDAREVLDSAERAAALTRQLLAFSRQQPLAPRILGLAETARGMEGMLHRLLGERVSLALDLRAPGRVRADPGQVELALMNLAVNARDAMPAGGRLDVEVYELEPDDPRRPAGSDVPEGPLAVLAVRDTGLGMSGEVRERIFEPFFTTKGSGKGTGLGLSTVLGIVTQSGGAVRVSSEPGRGAEFRIYLPRHVGDAASSRGSPRARSARGSETILLVEDDGRLRGVVRKALEERGYRVLEASSAPQASALAKGLPSPPDLLLTDVILPQGNGIDLAREIGATWPGLPVLLVSGYTGDHLAELDGLPPEAGFLPKPFTPEILLERVREALDARRR